MPHSSSLPPKPKRCSAAVDGSVDLSAAQGTLRGAGSNRTDVWDLFYLAVLEVGPIFFPLEKRRINKVICPPFYSSHGFHFFTEELVNYLLVY